MNSPAGKSEAYVSMSEGWALGIEKFKQALRRDHALAEDARAWTRAGVKEMREGQWRLILHRALDKLGKAPADAKLGRKGALWKVRLALQLKNTTQATNRWVTEQLHMGRPEAVSVHVGRLRKTQLAE